ncbi:MAG: carbamate kinase [Candidatus Aenigmarchaeota archaeon CG_4_10_14_0_8_um_filter_37_24]|nr:carbamate kinase [Candidatus Aenigmarchaeota archaeon]OIN87160.1 MAG: carbamate kinase [Candidatus Aenigmarchaeota archaeon CG1_02_38_14]PIV68931.1 MAG: carbamate kinase [Candidatus Aenigmarchaeota archaeon CG01_land_8_20_14_3_00_37_9]PIW41561.1 MAG: carbamate kinase [Candidatus Aenigmarchaeota archaeon CG15_BIG_FIL_POST_REV_8_21_14_020_37_27]PIX51110.1 MAG: carbamate kinase [Candidatus Aenigmarchaeota archaeon CG_4_8_14_3_um_filter_37_24]PIY35432.1 MAG: carbamate kinase [Candidatus Aenigma
MQKTMILALGGNMIKKAKEKGTFEEQYENVTTSCDQIIEIIKQGWNIVITHGNGPQVGNLLLQQELLKDKIPPMPLDVCGALSQGEIGYLVQQILRNKLKKNKINKKVVTIITQVLVDEKDPEFKNPSKPIGPFYKIKNNRFPMVYQTGKGWRRVVPSPDPKEIIEKDQIKDLVENGDVVIACGGGGIPVVERRGQLKGIEGVIDKDLASEKLAEELGIKTMMILTDVDNVYLNYGEKNQKKLEKVTLKEIKEHQKRGHFQKGSMGPKIEASIRLLENGGEGVFITSPKLAIKCLQGKAGTALIR